MFDSISPVEHKGEHLSYTADQVKGIQSGIEKNLKRMLDASDNTAQNASFGTTTDVAPQPVQTSEPDLPF